MSRHFTILDSSTVTRVLLTADSGKTKRLDTLLPMHYIITVDTPLNLKRQPPKAMVILEGTQPWSFISIMAEEQDTCSSCAKDFSVIGKKGRYSLNSSVRGSQASVGQALQDLYSINVTPLKGRLHAR